MRRETVDGKVRETRTDHMDTSALRLPAAALDWQVDAEIGEKARGIYKARLYSARLAATGTIAVPARATLEDGRSTYKWGTPRLVLGVSDPLGIRAAPVARNVNALTSRCARGACTRASNRVGVALLPTLPGCVGSGAPASRPAWRPPPSK